MPGTKLAQSRLSVLELARELGNVAETCRQCGLDRTTGAILDRARAHDPGFEDIAIAATAAAHGLTVLTANERHFAPFGVPMTNPLKRLPAD